MLGGMAPLPGCAVGLDAVMRLCAPTVTSA
jgi:hypothetical protein